MEWNDPLTTHLLDFLFEVDRNGLKTPLTVAGGFGLFLKRRYLTEQKEQTLFSNMDFARSTEDIDIFVHVDILCDPKQVQCIKDALHKLGYEVIDSAKYMQWKKPIKLSEFPGYIKMDFLAGNVGDAHRKQLHVKSYRVRNQQVEGLHAHITPEALFIDEKTLKIPLVGQRSSGDEYSTTICIPHPFTYLLMKLFAFRDRQNDSDKQLGSHHAFDIFTIIGSLTKNERDEAILLDKNPTQWPVIQEAKGIVETHFTRTSQKGAIAIRSHKLYQRIGGAEHWDEFVDTITEIFNIVHQSEERQ